MPVEAQVVLSPDTVMIEADRARPLALNLWTFYEADREIEQLSGQPMGSSDLLGSWFGASLTTARLLALVVAGLRQQDPMVTREQVEDMPIDFRAVGEMLDAMALVKDAAVAAQAHAMEFQQDDTPLREGVLLMLDRPRPFALPLGVCHRVERELEVILGRPYESVEIVKDFVGCPLDALRLLLLLTTGLRRQEKALTLERVGKMIPVYRFVATLNSISEAWQRANPSPVIPALPAEETALASPPFSDGVTSGVAPALI